MNNDPRTFFALLNEYLEDEKTGPKECGQLFSSLNETFTREEVNLFYLDLYLQHLFDKSHGLHNFITKVVNKKSFKSAVEYVYELIFTLINNFPSKLEKYVITIHEICFKVIKSSLVSANEKVKAFDVLILSFEKIDKCLENTGHYSEIYNNLLNSVHVKKCDTVQEKIFRALGLFAKNFQYVVNNYETLRIEFLTALEKQIIQPDYSNKIVSAVFAGLTYYCESFPFDLSVKEDEVISTKLYKYIETLSVLGGSSKTAGSVKVANRAALTFFAHNLSLFVNMVIEKYQHWHEVILQWLDYGPDDAKVGVVVLEAFYREVGIFLQNGVGPNSRVMTLYFLDCFENTLKNNRASNREKKLCLQGLSCFAAVFHVQLNSEEIKDLLMLIMQHFEQTYVLPQQPVTDTLEYLPNYLETVARLVHFKKVSNNELFCLQKGIIIMIKTFPQLPLPCHGAVIDSLLSTFYFLTSNDENIFDTFLENTVYQGVVWTCSHQHVSEAEISDDNSEQVITIRNYLSLWKGLLGILPVRKYDKLGIFLSDREHILVKLIHKLIRTMLILVNKLNVDIVLSSDTPLTDIQSAYQLVEVNDFAIFLNVVDFYQEIFTEIEPTILKKCICKLVHHFIEKCVKFPLISGFYKLLSCCLEICNKLNYFEDTNITSYQDVSLCYHSLLKFIELVLRKTQQFKGDLLIACLYVLLRYPIIIIRKMLPACVESFRTMFQVGRNYLKLTHLGIDTLECWQKQIESQEMDSFLVQVIPVLDSFLQSKSLGNLTQSNTSENRRKTKQLLKKRKVLIEIEPELFKLQMKILNFVGQQSSTLCRAFVSSDDNIDLAVWGNRQHLKLILPYQDIKLEIYLDKLLPRIINLSLYSTDRKTRVIACELLQATMMVFLGTTKQMTQSTLTDVTELLRHVVTPLLKLGCDLDQVIEQLFRPLCFQLIHWYTHITQSRNEHSAVVIEAILESITHPTDTALRDFSGKCLNEYVHWTIKQTTEKNLARDPISVKVLLKKMRFYSVHPDPFKKLGAALIFNNIYRELREESSLLSMFWLEFLHLFIRSLEMYEDNSIDENAVTQINDALTHIERVFVEKASLFNKSSSDRRTPTDMQGDKLKDVAVWLLTQTGSRSSYCRAKSMSLFANLSPHTERYVSFQDFVTKNVDKGTSWIKETYETLLNEHPIGNENFIPCKWLQALLCALDGYNFIIEKELVQADEHILSATLITAVKYFFDKLAIVNLDKALVIKFSKTAFEKLKSQAVLKAFQFFNNLLRDNAFCKSMELFYSQSLWNLVLHVLFYRHILGFEHLIPNDDNKALVKLLEQFLKRLPGERAIELVQVLNSYVVSNLSADIDFKRQVELKQRNIITGLNILQSFNLSVYDFRKCGSGLIAVLLNKLIGDAENEVLCASDLQDTTLNYCLSVFDFALCNESEFVTLINFLHKPYQVKTVGNNQTMHFGTYILTLLESSLMKHILQNFGSFITVSLKQNDLSTTVTLIIHILNYLVMNKKQMKIHTENHADCILKSWHIFGNYCTGNIGIGIDLVKYMIQLMKPGSLQKDDLKTWLIDMLICEENLSWKDELDMKIEIFSLLVDVTDAADHDSVKLQLGLSYIQNKFFSETSSVPLETKIISVDKLFCTVVKVRCPSLLLFLLHIYVRVVTKESNTDVKSVLTEYIRRNKEEAQEITISNVYKLCSNEDMNSLQKYRLIEAVTPLFQHCSSLVFEEFFVANISNILSVLQLPLSLDNLAEKIVQFILLELLFVRCPIQSKSTEISPIAQAAIQNNPTNQAFLLLPLKCSLSAFKDSLDASPDCVEFLRLYKCHSYNAIVSIVSNSMLENFYSKLFVRQENNVDILWSSIIDTKKVYAFETAFDEIPKRKKFLVNIRNQVKTQRKLQDHLKTVKYIETMRVYNSSLSEDVTKFDFNDSVIRNQEGVEDDDKTYAPTEIVLDCTDVNNHECMTTVCGFIVHMINMGITELPDVEDEEYSLPQWLEGIRTLLLSHETHPNVKIFWIKVIDNTATVFKHFAKWFLEFLLQFVVDKCAGNCLNYIVTDVVAILASWSTEVVPSTESEIRLASQLLTFLINHLNNERQDVFRYNLELIKTLIEAWKTSVTHPHELIFSKLSVDLASKKVPVGIHLSSIYLANNIAPWKENCTGLFCKTLFDIVRKSSYKNEYKPCAETIGLVLRFSTGEEYFPKIFENVHKLLSVIKDTEKHANILECLALHCPEIVDEYQLKILLSRIHAIPKQLRTTYLRIILKRSEVAGNMNEFITENWDTYVENDDAEVQVLALEIICNCLKVLRSSPRFKRIVEAICKHVSNLNVLCRTRMYEIAIFIYQDRCFQDEENLSLCREVLVQGLTDSDLEIQERVFHFWKSNTDLPVQISKRFTFLLTNLYKTNTENAFLGYTSYFLLDVIKNTQEYNDLLFEHPLEDCVFEDYYLQTNWRARHQSVVPLFAETVRSSSADWESFSGAEVNKLRRTQTSLEFAPTQSVRMKQLSQLTMSQSSLFVKSEEDQTFVNPNLVPLTYQYQKPKRRFLRDKSKIHKYFAYKELSKSAKKTEQRKDLVKERENKVKIYRNYRKGDLPDVQITLGDILNPLQALALGDGEIAKILYLEVFKCVLQKMRTEDEFVAGISTGINFIFNNSNQFNRNLFRTLLDVLLLCKDSVVLSPDLVASVCQSSGLTTLGVLLIEEYLISHDGEPSDAKRTCGFQTESETNFWVKLAGLYKEMNEWDVVTSIFLQKTECPDDTKKALIAESRLQWRQAQILYEGLINPEKSLEIKHFYYESCFKCFAHLGDWNGLLESIDTGYGWNKLWDQDWNQRTLLPWYISGQLKKALFNQSASNQFLMDLNCSLNSDNLEYLQTNFSEELAMLWIFRGEVDEAAQYEKIYINNFLESWQQLDPLYASLRYNKLLKLRNVVDIKKFLGVFHDLNVDCAERVRDLINYWNRTEEEKLPSIVLAEERVLYRKQFVNMVKEKIQSYEESDLQHLILELNKVKMQLDDYIIDTAIELNNFFMTKKYLTVYNQNTFKHKLGICKLASIKPMENPSDKLDILLKGCRALEPVFSMQLQTHQKLLAHLQLFSQLRQISSLLLDNEELFDNKKTDVMNTIHTNSLSSAEEITATGANQLKSVLHICENEISEKMETDAENSTARECTTIAECYVKLAYFAKDRGSELFTDFMFFVLRAMKYSSSEGKQLFPCILMEKNFTDQHTAHFIQETGEIPLWMFLGWIPQLLVNISTSKTSAVAPILINIAKTYPQSIMYAYRLSRENCNTEDNAESRKLIEALDEILLTDDRVDKFLTALSFIAVPNTILLYYWKKMMMACLANDFAQIKLIEQNIAKEVYCCKPDSRNTDTLQGNMYKKIEKFEKDFKKLASCKNAEMKRHLDKIKTEVEAKNTDRNNSKLLKDYSPWLASFSAHKINLDLEIPGQYDGKRMPLVQHHIKISGFSPNVSIMSSLRKPLRISILGNDTKEYYYLVKFGEDIRQDQRIQQIFTLMNHIFENDKNLHARAISTLTYQVVPLTTKLGIIQWIGNTTSLLDIITKSINDDQSLKNYSNLANSYYQWLQRKSVNQPDVHVYGRAAINYSRDTTIPKFRSFVHTLQWDVLRSALLKLSTNTEGFFALRNNFTRSYAVMCVSHWVLGVGDRHLSNSLICLNNGNILGIDFGHAFGTATQILPVPELVPFRLTPHIVALMEPLGEKGLFRATMIHCLNSLRLNTGSLLATMNVFIEEPSLDWLEHASRFTEASTDTWYPTQKIDQAKRKLNGAKSTTIMIEDLRAGHQRNEKYMNAYIKLVEGLPTDVRALKEGDNLPVEDQVDCLIDHATDYNLLGRMYHGWAAWV